MEIVICKYTFLPKIYFLKLKMIFEHVYYKDKIDYIIIKEKEKIVRITQDGLISLRFKGKVEDVKENVKWFKERILSKLALVDDNDSDFLKLIMKSEPTVLLLHPKEKDEVIFKKLNLEKDYSFKNKYLDKTYGNGLIIFHKSSLPKSKLDELMDYQMIFVEYQNLGHKLLKYNKQVYDDVEKIRQRDEVRFKHIPDIINHLIDNRRKVTSIFKKVTQLDDFLLQRKYVTSIEKNLKAIKLYDFDEMIRLNNYIADQYELTKNDISSTLELMRFIFEENEQKEINILQVIFAIGTIATIVSLGAMPGAKIIMELTGNVASGNIMFFDFQTLILWTLISVVAGIVLFIMLNYSFLYAKKLKIVNLLKKGNLKK